MTQVDFNALNKIATIEKLLVTMHKLLSENREKRWLSTVEVAVYTGYTKSTIEAMAKSKVFILDEHYYKPEGKLMFDKNEIDRWVIGMPSKAQESIQERVLAEFKADIASHAA